MAFIRTIPPARATGDTALAYRYMADVGGHSMVAKIVQMFSLRPGSMRRMIRSWELTMWMGTAPRALRETVAAAVSRLNDCHYWIDGHEAFLQAAGGDARRVAQLVDGSAHDATPLERSLLDLARATQIAPAGLTPTHLEPLRDLVGDDALDYVLVIGAFHFINRIADLLHVDPEALPAPLRRIEPVRRLGVRVASLLLGRMDLANRDYEPTYDAAVAAIAPVLPAGMAGAAAEALAPLRPRPKLVEILRLAVEERDQRSSLDRSTITRVQATVERALPRGIDESEGFHPRPPDPVEAFAFVGTRYARRTTAAMIEALRAAGYDDLAILDLAIAVADANQWARLYRMLGLAPALFYLDGTAHQTVVRRVAGEHGAVHGITDASSIGSPETVR